MTSDPKLRCARIVCCLLLDVLVAMLQCGRCAMYSIYKLLCYRSSLIAFALLPGCFGS